MYFPSRYYRANSVRYETESCNEICQLNHYCVITRVDYNEYRKCLQPDRDSRNSSTTANLALCPLALLICSSLVNLMGKLLRSFHGNKSNSTCKLRQQPLSTDGGTSSSVVTTSEDCSRCGRRSNMASHLLSSLSTVIGNYIIKFRKFPDKFRADGTVSNRLRFRFEFFRCRIIDFWRTLVNVRDFFKQFLVKCKTICQTISNTQLLYLVSLIVSFIVFKLCQIFVDFYCLTLTVFILMPLIVFRIHSTSTFSQRSWDNDAMAYVVNVFS